MVNFLRVYSVFGKILHLLWQYFYAIESIIAVVNDQILKNNLAIWSHCCCCCSHYLLVPNKDENYLLRSRLALLDIYYCIFNYCLRFILIITIYTNRIDARIIPPKTAFLNATRAPALNAKSPPVTAPAVIWL